MEISKCEFLVHWGTLLSDVRKLISSMHLLWNYIMWAHVGPSKTSENLDVESGASMVWRYLSDSNCCIYGKRPKNCVGKVTHCCFCAIFFLLQEQERTLEMLTVWWSNTSFMLIRLLWEKYFGKWLPCDS